MKIPKTMQAVLLTGHGGLDMLSVKDDHPVPIPENNHVLVRVGAAGVNNTDINTRIGWYSKQVSSDTETGALDGFSGTIDNEDSSWSGAAIDFPRIQGADCCGEIIDVGKNVDTARIGERVLITAIQPRAISADGVNCITFGSECDGGFAEYAVVDSQMAFAINSSLTDGELASFPCAASTAENMLDRINLGKNERVVITGASGGVGSAAVQLAKHRGAHVTAIASGSKHGFVRSLGADMVLERDAQLEQTQFDVVVDLVVGDGFTSLIHSLRRGGRYIAAGAIGGPLAELDLRTIYLRDLILAGSTYQPPHLFRNLVKIIEEGALKPVVSKTYPLSQIASAQAEFIAKKYPGKLVLVPDALNP